MALATRARWVRTTIKLLMHVLAVDKSSGNIKTNLGNTMAVNRTHAGRMRRVKATSVLCYASLLLLQQSLDGATQLTASLPQRARDGVVPEVDVFEVLHEAEDVDDVIQVGQEVVTHVQLLDLWDQLQGVEIKHLERIWTFLRTCGSTCNSMLTQRNY